MGHIEPMTSFQTKIVGVMNPLVALLAKEAGFHALYLSGASLSSQWGMPDLGVLTLNDIVEATRKITRVTDLPLIVDIDNGWNHPLLLERGGYELKQAGAATAQIEDQSGIKRCGHLSVKELITKEEMCQKITLLRSTGIKVLARTDALGVEGIDKTIDRLQAYVYSGADAVFLEGAASLDEIAKVKKAVKVPLCINLTEFGKTPLWDAKDLDVEMVLYPMTVNRVIYKAAKEALEAIQKDDRNSLLPHMMTREELYKLIHYYDEENKL